MAARVGKRLLVALSAIVLGVCFLRWFVFGLYVVETDSMAPTLVGSTGGEYVVVTYGGRSDIKRWDLVALTPGGGERYPRVKRVVGLPGEEVVLRGGDVWIDRAVLSPSQPRPDWIPVRDEAFDSQSGREGFERAWRLTEAWRFESGRLVLDAEEVDQGAGLGLTYLRQPFKDGYLDRSGLQVEGTEVVGDAAVELHVEFSTPPEALRMGLTEQGDRFELRVLKEGDAGRVRLERHSAAGEELIAEGEVPWAPGEHRLRLQNRDDTLEVQVDDEFVLTAPYTQNNPLLSDPARRGFSAPTERVYFGGWRGVATFSRVRVERDLHYIARGKFAHEEPLLLGPNELFVLGDHSSDSHDGRDWGPTPLSEVLGSPIAVFWPLARARRLSRPGAD